MYSMWHTDEIDNRRSNSPNPALSVTPCNTVYTDNPAICNSWWFYLCCDLCWFWHSSDWCLWQMASKLIDPLSIRLKIIFFSEAHPTPNQLVVTLRFSSAIKISDCWYPLQLATSAFLVVRVNQISNNRTLLNIVTKCWKPLLIMNCLIDWKGVPPETWLLRLQYVCFFTLWFPNSTNRVVALVSYSGSTSGGS